VSIFKKFLNFKGIIGITLVLCVVLIAIFAPLIIPPEFATKMDMRARLSPPNMAHWMGTDQLGRDLFYRVMLGARTSINIATSAVLMSLVIGLPLGLVSGYFGGRTDNVLMRLVDTLLSFPALLLALTISAVLGPNLQNTIIAIGIAFTPYLARLIRGEALRVAQMPYVEAARSSVVWCNELSSDYWSCFAKYYASGYCPIYHQSCICYPGRSRVVIPRLGNATARSFLGVNDTGFKRLS